MQVARDQQSADGPQAGCHRFGRTERLYYGRPFAAVVAEECDRLGKRRAFLLTTASLGRSALVSRLAEAVGPRLVGRFDQLPAHTPRRAVLAAATAARQAGADLLVVLGGGSVIDAAKAVLLCLWTGADSAAALAAVRDGEIALPSSPIRMIAVPTTLSGAEFTDMAGVSNDQGRKERFGHPLMAPLSVVLDPAATLATPLPLWLSTGMRAVDHAVETVCAPRCDLLSEVAALRGLGLLAAALPRVAVAPEDLAARRDCQLGLWMAAIGAGAGVPMGASHGIGHILGAEFGLPHGITSCVMMSAVLTWNRPVTAERQRLIEAQMAVAGATAAEKIDALLALLGLPRRLSEVGIGADAFAQIAERSLTDFFIPTNPRPIRGVDDITEILRLAA